MTTDANPPQPGQNGADPGSGLPPSPSSPPVPAVTASTLPRTLEESYQRNAELERLLSARDQEIKILKQERADRDKIIAEYLRTKGK